MSYFVHAFDEFDCRAYGLLAEKLGHFCIYLTSFVVEIFRKLKMS